MLKHSLFKPCCVIFIGYQQVDETVYWLSDYFLRSRLGKPELRSFGLYSAWAPYITEVVSLWDHLIGCLISVQLSACARESVGSSKIMKGNCKVSARDWSVIQFRIFVHILGCYLSLRKWNGSCTFTALQDVHSKIVKLFKPWIFPLDTEDGG